MRSQRLKDAYFAAVRPLAKINALRWSVQRRLRPLADDQKLFLNLGCGEKYIDTLLNIEGNLFRRKDIWLDLRNRLPFPDQSVHGIYSSHVFEHFYADELRRILRECHRILRPRGAMRILVPSLEQAISAYVTQRGDWFPDFPSPFGSIGGKFFNYVFCDSQHRLALDFSFLEELLQEADFTTVARSEPRKSAHFPRDILEAVESERIGYIQTSLVVEAYRE